MQTTFNSVKLCYCYVNTMVYKKPKKQKTKPMEKSTLSTTLLNISVNRPLNDWYTWSRIQIIFIINVPNCLNNQINKWKKTHKT